MSQNATLAAALQEIIDGLKRRRPKLDGRLLHAKEQVANLEAEIDENRRALERAPRFQEAIGGELQCPRCWVFDEARSPLKPVPSQTKDDIFRCRSCKYELIVRW